ncbi:MAG: hypothetical protein M3167_00130 [Acidobacteriota bacterium]|nr:hypothetical protein [Acidobacteriota bacterium]
MRSPIVAGLVLLLGTPLAAQVLSVGFNNPYYGGSVNPTRTQTTLQTAVPASVEGVVTTAIFGWSTSPCTAAVKIKFFRPFPRINAFHPIYTFLAERGPFDVAQPVQSSPLYPPVTQIVNLTPAVALRAGDVIAITNLTGCGGPTYVANLPPPLPPNGLTSLTVPGDASGDIFPVPPGPPVFLTAFGTTRVLPLLGGRFHVTMAATDPRTGATATGSPNGLSNEAGYFSLPDFTGDSHRPELTVKMLDATKTPALGGTFWVFYAPLSDVSYTLTIVDSLNGTTRTYSNLPGAGQICGGIDTGAFLP